jgi:hypothetical protein
MNSANLHKHLRASSGLSITRRLFYFVKYFIPRDAQIAARRWLARSKFRRVGDIWPIDSSCAAAPIGWKGWPEEKKFALVLTHDVESLLGQTRCKALAELEKQKGFRSSFNFVPRRYEVSTELRTFLGSIGFEVGVHGLYHDGRYFVSERIWKDRVTQINKYISEWNASGFRIPSMIYDLEKILDLDIEYDASTFDTDPFEPKPVGMKKIFPFWVAPTCDGQKGYVELPYTLPQDFTLYIIFKDAELKIWKKKLDWIVEKGGMALLNTHPDYMSFSGVTKKNREFPVRYYTDFLSYVGEKYAGQYWNPLPRELARFYKAFHEGK